MCQPPRWRGRSPSRLKAPDVPDMFTYMDRRKDPAVHGRGAQSGAVPQRFGLAEREADGDWRDYVERLDGPPVKLRTTVTEEHPKTILTFNQSPDIGFDRSINAYRGCEHGCIYCFARPTHAFHDLSPGLDFETRLFAKPQAAELLRKTLARPKYRVKPIAMGTNTDPYQPIERRYRITRQVLEVCLEARHPVTITTKSDRVLDDLDLLAELARRNLTAVAISVTTFDPKLSGKLEPRAAAPAKRLDARFERARQLRVEGRDRDRHRREISPRQLGQQVEIVEHAIGLGGDGHRMARLEAHFEHLPGDAVARLDRLVGIGVGPIAMGRGLYFGRASVSRSSAAALGLANSRVSKSSPGERS